jgi:hypothetical protein
LQEKSRTKQRYKEVENIAPVKNTEVKKRYNKTLANMEWLLF